MFATVTVIEPVAVESVEVAIPLTPLSIVRENLIAMSSSLYFISSVSKSQLLPHRPKHKPEVLPRDITAEVCPMFEAETDIEPVDVVSWSVEIELEPLNRTPLTELRRDPTIAIFFLLFP